MFLTKIVDSGPDGTWSGVRRFMGSSLCSGLCDSRFKRTSRYGHGKSSTSRGLGAGAIEEAAPLDLSGLRAGADLGLVPFTYSCRGVEGSDFGATTDRGTGVSSLDSATGRDAGGSTLDSAADS